jgi:hypothetical protein
METGMAYVTIFMEVVVVVVVLAVGLCVVVHVVSFSCVTNEGHANDQTGMEIEGKGGMGDLEKEDGNDDLSAPTRTTTTTEDRHQTRRSLKIVFPIHPNVITVVVVVVQFLFICIPTMIYCFGALVIVVARRQKSVYLLRVLKV